MIGRPPRHYLQIEVQRVDFPRIMIMLKVRNYGPNAVARVLGCYHTTAINWAEGGEPGYRYGEALIKLFRQIYPGFSVPMLAQETTTCSTQTAA